MSYSILEDMGGLSYAYPYASKSALNFVYRGARIMKEI
jgi:hypothetical protein